MSARAVTASDIVRAIRHDDQPVTGTSERQMERIIQAALLKLGLCTVGGSEIAIEIGNGHLLRVRCEKAAA